ncbi:MAG: HAMP domain-containing sensor histidine kinase [Pseudomonadota bacterium]
MKTKQNKSKEDGLSFENNENQVSYFSKIGHELKTPIHGIQGLAEYLINNWDDTNVETQKKCISSILEASQRLMELVSTLSLEKLKQTSIEFNFVQTDIVEITKKTVENFRDLYLLDSKISLELTVSEDSFVSDIDKFWYQQLLTNLLANAYNYSEDGVISVDIRSQKVQQSEYLLISITDQGIGIPESELNSIFAPYSRSSRANSSTEGTGLGLAICREIVQAHKGIITAVNNEKVGSTVEFSIPKYR